MAAILSATELADVLATSYKTVKRLAAQERWYTDELPMPVEGKSPRRWCVEDVDSWLVENERRARCW
jgi:hypothetical protein